MYTSDLKHPNRTLEEKLHAIYNLKRDKKIDLSFRPPYLNLLKALDDPQEKIPNPVHIAGTNGKGSIVAMLRAVLEQAGYKVHAYTSPHLCAFNERIVLAGQDITDEALEPLIDEALSLNKGAEATFFEITTAIAFAAFSRAKADFTLLETGLGGRLDCTNIIEKPMVSVINSVSYDHMDMLGESLHKIAAEKAGIIKRNVPCILGPQREAENITDVFERKADDLNAALYRYGHEWFIEPHGDLLRFTFEDKVLTLPRPSLAGPHQIDNLGTAVAALQMMAKTCLIKEQDMQKGVQKAAWRGRLQNLTGRTKASLPPGWEIWLDVGHNEAAGRALAAQAVSWNEQDPDKPLHVIVAMLRHKDPKRFLEPLLPHLKTLHIIDIPGEEKSLKAPELRERLGDTDERHTIAQAGSFEEALENILRQKEQSGRILIAGSVYLGGHILREYCYTA